MNTSGNISNIVDHRPHSAGSSQVGDRENSRSGDSSQLAGAGDQLATTSQAAAAQGIEQPALREPAWEEGVTKNNSL